MKRARDHSHDEQDHEAPASATNHGRRHAGHEEHEEGVPEWMVSFADNTALMMGFFVILLALNLGPKGAGADAKADSQSQAARESGQSVQELDWALGVRQAFNNPINPFSTDPRDRILAMRLREKMGLAQSQGVQGPHDETQSQKHEQYINVVLEFPFDAQQSALSTQARRQLDELASIIKGNRFVYEIRGNIDFAEATQGEAAAMQLSFNRAMAAANHLAHQGVDWQQLKLTALGTGDPAQIRAYQASEHTANRRVEIIQTQELMKD